MKVLLQHGEMQAEASFLLLIPSASLKVLKCELLLFPIIKLLKCSTTDTHREYLKLVMLSF